MIWPRPVYANPQLSRTSRTSTCTHRQLSSCSWAVKKNKSGNSLPGSRPWSVFFFASLFHLTLCRQPHSLSVCEDSVSDAHQASRRYSDSLSLSHTLSHTLSPSSKSDPGRLNAPFGFVCLENGQGSERFCPIHARTTALLNQPQAQLTDDRRIDMHVNPQSLRLIREKFSQANKLRTY